MATMTTTDPVTPVMKYRLTLHYYDPIASQQTKSVLYFSTKAGMQAAALATDIHLPQATYMSESLEDGKWWILPITTKWKGT